MISKPQIVRFFATHRNDLIEKRSKLLKAVVFFSFAPSELSVRRKNGEVFDKTGGEGCFFQIIASPVAQCGLLCIAETFSFDFGVFEVD